MSKASTKPRPLKSKIKTTTALAQLLSRAKRKNTQVVFTNGCFDILHKGHVTYLEKAKALGDILVVALNADVSVRKLKGANRPINPLDDRLDVMAALEVVDYVTWFDEDTPLKAILKIRPDILVKGGDWKVEQIVGGREIGSWGGKVKALPFVEGKSTTAIIEKASRRD